MYRSVKIVRAVTGARVMLPKTTVAASVAAQKILKDLKDRLTAVSFKDWQESLHPRGPGGKFAPGSGGSSPQTQQSLASPYKLPSGMSRDDAKAMGMHPTWVKHKDWHEQAYGGVIVNSHGQFLLREPAGHFDGYHWTWPKGKQDDKEEHPVDTALRETTEETGYRTKIFDHLPHTYQSGTGSYSSFYLMRPKGYDPGLMDNETKGTKWATYQEARDLIKQSKNEHGRARDLAILERAHAHLSNYSKEALEAGIEAEEEWKEELHPRGPGGKFAPGGGSLNSGPAAHHYLTQKGWQKQSQASLKNPKTGTTWSTATHPASYKFYWHPQHGTMMVAGPNFFHQHPKTGEFTKAQFKDALVSHLEKLEGTPKPAGYEPVVTPPAEEKPTPVEKPVGESVPSAAPSHLYDQNGKTPDPATEGKSHRVAAPDGLEKQGSVEPKKSGPPEGMPNAVKGPKGGVYQWNEGQQLYVHSKTGTYTLSPDYVKKQLQQGTYKEHDPNAPKAPTGAKAALAAKIPEGMHSSYTQPSSGAKWHAKFNEATGMYDKYKGTKFSQSVAPHYFQSKLDSGATHYVPDKNAVAGTGPKVAMGTPVVAPATKPASSFNPVVAPAATQKAEFTYKNAGLDPAGKPLGGAHEKVVFTDKQGNDWLFKPATTLSGAPNPLVAHADELAAKIQAKLRPDIGVEAKTATLNIPGKGEQFGSIQKMVPNVAPDKDFKGAAVTQLTPTQVKGLQQEQVVDWLISNHDSHGAQFVKTTDDKVIGIDKSQAFKYFPNDKLSADYHPNATYGEKPPIYNDMWKAAKAGKLAFDPNDALPAIKKAEAISDTDYKKMLAPYAATRFSNSDDANKFLDTAVERKNNLKSDFEKLYSDVLGKDFKFDDSKAYSAKPPVVSQEMHEALEDQGYKFDKLGKNTGKPLYQNPEGKAVYVGTDPAKNEWEFYPMGPKGSNPYGSSKGLGTETLIKKTQEPFEKPEPAVAQTFKYESGGPLSTPKHGALEELPYAPVKDQTVLESGHTIGGNPEDYVKGKSTGKGTPVYTESEKHVVSDYKGSGYHSINSFLYNGGDAESNSKIKNLISAVNKGATDRDLILFRGLRGDYSNQVRDKQLFEGSIIEPKCFQSTSTHQAFSHESWSSHGNVVLKISAPKGTPALAVKHVTSSLSHEKEIILSPDVKYKVNKVYQSYGRIYADVDAFMEKAVTGSIQAALQKSLTPEEYVKLRPYFNSDEAMEIGLTQSTLSELRRMLLTPPPLRGTKWWLETPKGI